MKFEIVIANVQSTESLSGDCLGSSKSAHHSQFLELNYLELAGGFSFSIDFIPLYLTVHVFGDLHCLFSFCIHSFGFVLCVAFWLLMFLVMLGYF